MAFSDFLFDIAKLCCTLVNITGFFLLVVSFRSTYTVCFWTKSFCASWQHTTLQHISSSHPRSQNGFTQEGLWIWGRSKGDITVNVYNKTLIKVPRCFGREIGILQGELIGAYQVPYSDLFGGGCKVVLHENWHLVANFTFVLQHVPFLVL